MKLLAAIVIVLWASFTIWLVYRPVRASIDRNTLLLPTNIPPGQVVILPRAATGEALNEAIHLLPADGGVVLVRAGTVVTTHIPGRENVTILGVEEQP